MCLNNDEEAVLTLLSKLRQRRQCKKEWGNGVYSKSVNGVNEIILHAIGLSFTLFGTLVIGAYSEHHTMISVTGQTGALNEMSISMPPPPPPECNATPLPQHRVANTTTWRVLHVHQRMECAYDVTYKCSPNPCGIMYPSVGPTQYSFPVAIFRSLLLQLVY